MVIDKFKFDEVYIKNLNKFKLKMILLTRKISVNWKVLWRLLANQKMNIMHLIH